jgi:hypothetical protein
MSKLIFKIFDPSETFHGVDYNERKQQREDAKLIHFENFGHLQNKSVISRAEFKEYFTLYSQRNKRVKLPQFHAVISCKGTSFTVEQLKNHALDIMQKLGYGGNPILLYEHSDTVNRHVHIVTSRIEKQGKKINDSFEKQRANNILSEILNLNTQEQFERDLASCLLYKCSTEKQFLLLMELKGYRVKLNASENQFKNFYFYKHGKMQGSYNSPPTPRRGDFGRDTPLESNRGRMYSIIKYYKEKYSVEQQIDEHKKKYSGQKYTTPLTEHLKKTFGWEFVFFKSGNHEKPYGYVIIDHKNRQVYKGNEVMKLHELLNIDKTNTAGIRSTTENKALLNLDSIAPATVPTVPNVPTTTTATTTETLDYQPPVFTEALNEIGNLEMAEADSLAKRVTKPAKSKKKIKY